jgi:hypothetical protein
MSKRTLGAAAVALAMGAVAALVLLGGEPTSSVQAASGPVGRFPAPAAGGSATLWAVGDGADGSEATRRVARLIATRRSTGLLYLGDVYDSGSAREFRTNYDDAYGGLKLSTAPTPGNHDWPSHAEGYNPYWRSVTGKRPPEYYSFRLAGWQVLSLNSEGELDEGSAQGRWLRRRLSGPGNCRIAFWHRPRYSAGSHGDQPDVEPIWSQMAGRVRLVLNGHDHNMQQMRAQAGVTQLISGGGGHGHYALDEDYPGLAWSNDRTYGALRIRLTPGRARYAFVGARGRVLRRGSARCSS